jgi:hypothetical protein
MEKEITKKKDHLRLPNELIKQDSISPKDLLVYLALMRFENWETHTAKPSMARVAQLCSSTRQTIAESIKRLVKTDYLDVQDLNKGKLYTFKKPTKNFEMFSLDFLDNKNLSFTEKAYLVAQQQYLIKSDHVGKTTYSSYEMSGKINMSPTVIQRCDKSLQAKEYLTIVPTKSRDSTTGLLKNEKIFNLEKFGQAVVFVLKNHEDSIQELKQENEALRKNNESFRKNQDIILRELNRLKKAQGEPELILD